MRGYQQLISEAVGTEDPATIKVVEEIMRTDRTSLDGLTPAQFHRAARTAYADMVLLAGTGNLAEYCEALQLEMPARILI